MANSAYTVQKFKQINPAFVDLPIRVCPLGVEPAPFSSERPMATPGKIMPERFALMVSRMVVEDRYKGHDMLLELWREVLQSTPQLNLVIVGEGSDRPRLQEKCRNLGLEDYVIFTGLIPDEQLRGLYSDCEFFVLPSSGEGFGLVFLEAMRAGKACIAAHGAAAEIVEPGVTGLLVNSDSPREVRNAVQRLAGDPQLAKKMGMASYQRFLDKFTADRFAESLLSALGI
jgi:phosphatidylinositol alpha-1,6-mannosyltransferase